MTTAILAQNTTSSVARARLTLSLPSARALALGASLACHTGLGVLAYTHATAQPVFVPKQASPTSVEILLAPNVELAPAPTVAPPPAADEVRSSSRPTSAPRAVAASVTPVTAAQPTATASASASAAPLGAAEPAAPRFIMQAPVVTASVSGLSGASARGSASAPSAEPPFTETQVDSPAKLQAGTPPTYTAAAEAAGVEVELPLEIVVDRTGAVQSARTLEHVGYGLDEAALAAVRRYRFSPARRAGSAAAVRMRWVLRFQLR